MGFRPHTPDASCRVETVRPVEFERNAKGHAKRKNAQESPGGTGASGCTWGPDLMPPMLPVGKKQFALDMEVQEHQDVHGVPTPCP